MNKKQNLYKVQADNWNKPVFAAASNQLEAIDNVSETDPSMHGERCSVVYLGNVYLSGIDTNTEHVVELEAKYAEQEAYLRKLEGDNLKLRVDIQRICEGKLITVEQIKSVYAAAGMCDQLHEKTDSDNLMALWATLKEWHKELTGKEA